MISFLEWLQEMSFASRFGGVKNKWVKITAIDVQEDPELAGEIFAVIDDAYKSIGGHVDIRSPQDVVKLLSSGDMSYFKAIDTGSDTIDALVGYKPKFGQKGVVSASRKGGKESWLDYMKHSHSSEPGNYSEVSDAAAAVLLKAGIPVVENEAMVRQVLGNKHIEWYGEFPEFEAERMQRNSIKEDTIKRFRQFKGWYGRILGDGQTHVKIMIGLPSI